MSCLPHSVVYEVDHGSCHGVIYRAKKHRTVIEISSDDDDGDDGETTPAAKAKGR